MMEIKAKTRKWGNSIGVILPKELVRVEKIKANEEITLHIHKKVFTKGRDIWGTMKFKESTEKLMRQVDKDLDWGF